MEEYRPYLPKNGYVEVYEIEEDNSLTCIMEKDKNLFVNTSFDIMAGLLQGDITKVIDTVSLGDGGIVDSELQYPSKGDTSLYSEVFRKVGLANVEVQNILTPNYIKFKFVIEKDEANGPGIQVINELGLLSSDGTMFSRKTLSTEIVKSPDKAIMIYWELSF